MSTTKLRFALFGNVFQTHKSAAVRQLVDSLRRHDALIAVDREYCDFLSGEALVDTRGLTTFTGSDFEADFALSMGGDGTLLKTASRVGQKQTPIVGVNMGRLGFLAGTGASDVDATVEALFRGDYCTEDRALISVDSGSVPIEGCTCALNDVAILKRDSASMITIAASIDGEHLVNYQADGLIVSTPTGSTAYSLSNGGPIIVPRTGVMLLTAVAPHSLNVRPIVIPDQAVVELTVSSRSHTFLVAIDGRSVTLPEGTTLRLTKAPHVARIVKRKGESYFATLREKMMWGADSRG